MVRLIAEVEVAFEALEGGKHLLPGPLGVPGGRPAVVVLGHPAQGDCGVHGTRTAGDAAAGNGRDPLSAVDW